MIKINLIPRKRTPGGEQSQQTLYLGVLILLIAGAAVVFLVHRPLNEKIERLQDATSRLARENKAKEGKLKDFKKLKAAVEQAEKRTEVIMRLNKARATPANMMRELSSLLTPRRMPTMTKKMSEEIEDNPNRKFSQEWDAKHVWITKFSEKNGEFQLDGGAQSDGDMTQLALRLQASVYFHDVVPKDGREVVDKDSGVSYYKFTIVGKVAY